jgi:S-layer homology domain
VPALSRTSWTRSAPATIGQLLLALALATAALVGSGAVPMAQAGTDSVSVQKSTTASGLQQPGDTYSYTITAHVNTAVERLVIADGAFDYPQIAITGTSLSVNGAPRTCNTTRPDNVWCGIGNAAAGTTVNLVVTVKVNPNVDIACDRPGQHGTLDATAHNIAKARWQEAGVAFRSQSPRVSVNLDCDGYDPTATPPPTAVIHSHPPSTTTSSSATFTFSATGGATSFRCAIDSSAYAPCTSPKTYTNLGVGQHAFYVQGVNAVGAGAAASFEWRVTNPFTDIGSSPFRGDILWLYGEGITGGCSATKFCPTASVTRGQMAAFLNRALNLPATSTDFFADDDASMFEGDINRLAAAGITGGCAAGRFCPDAEVTREQMASFLVRALDLPGSTVDRFTDDETSIHEGDINRLAAAGITGGCTATNFCPRADVTRGQMAAFLYRALAD